MSNYDTQNTWLSLQPVTGVKYTDGTTQTTASSTVSASIQTFTSTETWTRPAGVNVVRVMVIGGGGGSQNAGFGRTVMGSGSQEQDESIGTHSDGGHGGVVEDWIDISGDTSIVITIGAGGAGGVSGYDAGSDGGDSSFGSYLTGKGGTAGKSYNATTGGEDGEVTASGAGAIRYTGAQITGAGQTVGLVSLVNNLKDGSVKYGVGGHSPSTAQGSANGNAGVVIVTIIG